MGTWWEDFKRVHEIKTQQWLGDEKMETQLKAKHVVPAEPFWGVFGAVVEDGQSTAGAGSEAGDGEGRVHADERRLPQRRRLAQRSSRDKHWSGSVGGGAEGAEVERIWELAGIYEVDGETSDEKSAGGI